MKTDKQKHWKMLREALERRDGDFSAYRIKKLIRQGEEDAQKALSENSSPTRLKN